MKADALLRRAFCARASRRADLDCDLRGLLPDSARLLIDGHGGRHLLLRLAEPGAGRHEAGAARGAGAVRGGLAAAAAAESSRVKALLPPMPPASSRCSTWRA